MRRLRGIRSPSGSIFDLWSLPAVVWTGGVVSAPDPDVTLTMPAHTGGRG
ncbi:MAG: hypothetical protein ACLTQL_08180 [Eisenbergiella sp.]